MFKIYMKYLLALFLAITLTACGGSSSPAEPPPIVTNPPAPPVTPPAPPTVGLVTDQIIKLNQLGYITDTVKIAIVPATAATEFQIKDTSDDSIVFTGTLSTAMTWDVADAKEIQQADFSSLARVGTYQLLVAGVEDSTRFKIANDVYNDVHDAAIKAYYFNRASTELTANYAGQFQRPIGHPDTSVKIHSSAASAARPEGSVFAAPKGWYDAGDFGKYIVNSGISTYTLLAAYQHFPDFYNTRNLNIPESGNSTPDLLDEVMWNLDWMLAMQDPNDGGVYHKLTTLNFSGEQMPHQATAERYFIQKSTAATLNFAAVMAMASRVYANFNTDYSGKSALFRQAAINAWQWATANPNIIYSQAGLNVNTGEYGDTQLNDEFAWAAAELFLLTQTRSYLDDFFARNAGLSIPSWPNVSALGTISLLNAGSNNLSAAEILSLENSLLALANNILSAYNNSSYKVSMSRGDFIWGSNSVALNRAWIMLEAFKRNNNAQFREAAHGTLDYVLGRNPTDYSFVTGFGAKSPMGIHHRQSRADGIMEPVPGFLAGGPQPGKQDGCAYPSSEPALTYLDDWCSYSTNEVTINWNAPLVYVIAALSNL